MSAFNSFFIATGSNLGDRKQNLLVAKNHLKQSFELIAESRIFESPAVEYLNQPDFYNQVLEFDNIPNDPELFLTQLLNIEKEMGRNRLIPKGPRLIDLDILFLGLQTFSSKSLHVPHPRLFERSFVVLPLSELPGFKILNSNYIFNFNFNNQAIAIS